MGKPRIAFTTEELKWIDEHIKHNGRTIVWKVDINSRARAGEQAGSGQGLARSMVPVNRRKVYAASVAWYLLHGEQLSTDMHITFRNGDPTDLRKSNLQAIPASATGFGLRPTKDYIDRVVRTPEGKWKAFSVGQKSSTLGAHLRFIPESYLDEAGRLRHRPKLFDTREEAVKEAIKVAKRGYVGVGIWGRPFKHDPRASVKLSNGTMHFKTRN